MANRKSPRGARRGVPKLKHPHPATRKIDSETEVDIALGPRSNDAVAVGSDSKDLSPPNTAEPIPSVVQVGFFRKHYTAIVTLVGVLAAIITLVVATLTWLAPNPAPLLPAEVSISSVGINRVADMPFDQTYAGLEHNSITKKQSVVDIVLRNDGSAPSLVHSIVANFDYASELENCNPGRGPVVVTGNYDIQVPLQPPAGHFELRNDKVVFQLAPAAYDRLGVTIGPNETRSGDYPWLYSLTLTVSLDSGSSLVTSRVGFVSPSQDTISAQIDAETALPSEVPCFLHNEAQLSHVIAMGGQVSPTLSNLLAVYQNAVRKATS